ncbi:MAG: hypothetical protein M3O94_05700, partial [Actinomycetota bacterium]|nr:hypothetical protein [Actinomycetota bacterium]
VEQSALALQDRWATRRTEEPTRLRSHDAGLLIGNKLRFNAVQGLGRDGVPLSATVPWVSLERVRVHGQLTWRAPTDPDPGSWFSGPCLAAGLQGIPWSWPSDNEHGRAVR